MSYEIPTAGRSNLVVNMSTPGETIENKIDRIVNGDGELKQGDGAPLLYTERKEGIRASTNIRTDRFEIAIEATERIAKSYKARREEKGDLRVTPKEKDEVKDQSIQGNDSDKK